MRAQRTFALRLALAASAVMLAVLPARAQDAERRALERAIVEAISAGKPTAELSAEWTRRFAGQSAPAPRAKRTEGAVLREAIEEVRAAVDAAKAGGDGARVARAMESLRAADALATASFDDARERLGKTTRPPEFGQRLDAAQANVRRAIDSLYEALGSAPPLAKSTGARTATPQMLERAAAALRAIPAEAPAPVLRATTLPVRPVNLSARAPVATPVIVPAYLNPGDTQPVPADSAQAVEAPLSPEIAAKAQSLGYDYVRIFEYVRNEIRTEWYAGSQKAATGVLRSGAGNAVDQASLLIALLRASGAPARYVDGVIELPVETVAAQLGIADATLVPDALTRAGIAFTGVVQGGRVALVRMEHTWVAAHVPYTNYRGVVMDTTGRTWLPMDAWLKRLEGHAATPLVTTGALTSEYPNASITDTRDFLAYARQRLTAGLAAGTTYDQARGAERVVEQRLDLLPNTLPYRVVAVTREAADLATRHAVSVRLRLFATSGAPAAGLDLALPLHEAVNNRVTLSYEAGTLEDHRVSLLWGGIDHVPAYLVKVRPNVFVGGLMREAGTGLFTPGAPVRFEATLTGPFGTQTLEQTLTVGAYHAVAFAAGSLTRPATVVGDQEFDAARLLDGIAQTYTARWKAAEDEFALLTGTAIVRPLPALTMVNNYLRADAVANVTFSASWRGVTMDALARFSEPIGSVTARGAWMELSAHQGSSLENIVFREEFKVDSVSADRVLSLAGGSVAIDAGNLEAQLATTSHSAGAKDDIRNWVRQGFTVTTHAAPMTRGIWTGSAWVVRDPASRASGYFLSGALAGGSSTDGDWLQDFLADALANPHGGDGAADPLAAASITIVADTDGQFGNVGQKLDRRLAVRVRDAQGAPVKGARVKFQVLRGGGTLTSADATSNAAGVAEAELTLGPKTDVSPLFVKRVGDEFSTQVGQNFVLAAVDTRGDPLLLTEPINAYAMPDKAATLRRAFDTSFTMGIASVLNMMAEDRFGNPVSNVALTMTPGTPSTICQSPPPATPASIAAITACAPAAHYGECGSAAAANVKTQSSGIASAWVITPPVAGYAYPIAVTAGTLSSTTFFTANGCTASDAVMVLTRFGKADRDGRLVDATKVGTQYHDPIAYRLSALLPTGGQCTSSTMQVVPVSSISSQSTALQPSGSMTALGNVGAGRFQAFVTAGSTPGLYSAQLSVTADLNFSCTSNGVLQPLPPLTLNYSHPVVYGLETKIDSAIPVEVPAGTDTAKLHLGTDGRLTYPVEIAYTIKPPEYFAETSEVALLANNTETANYIGPRFDKGKVRLEAGFPLDITKRNEAQLVLNRGGGHEVRSDLFELPLRQKIIVGVAPRRARVTTDVDIANNRACRIGAEYSFELARAAHVTLKATARDDATGDPTGSPITLINDQPYDKGTFTQTLLAEQFLPRLRGYALELTAVAQSEPSLSEKAESDIQVVYSMNDALPVGQVVVKGVNVKSGRLVVPGQSIQVTGRGPQLAFRPVYSSGGSGAVGALGANWSHNYEASLSITPCNDVVVSTGDAGSMRFHPGPNSTLVPGKGYHGTLIANQQTNAFDFYSKDGTRYRFIFVAGIKRWVLESIFDANGNTLTLTRDLSTREAPLKTVTDSTGRTLKFTYETRDFHSGSAAVIVGVEGPDGMKLAYDYDEHGNLVDSKREDMPEAHETYGYSTAEPQGFANLLTGHTNARGKLTQYVHEPRTLAIEPTIGGAPAPATIPDRKVSTVTAPDNGVTTFTYAIPAPGAATPQTTTILDPRSKPTVYTLDRYGSPLTIQTPAGTTTMTWDLNDVLMRQKVDAIGTNYTYTYDANGNVESETVVGQGGVSYSSGGTWLAQTAPPYIKSRPLTRRDRNNNATTYGYDAAGNLKTETRPEGVALRYDYYPNGDRFTATDGRGFTTTFTYDAYGNLETTKDPRGGLVTTNHDVRGRLRRIVDQEGRATQLNYDGLDFLETKTDARGSVRTTDFDALGNKLLEIDEEGRRTTFEYDDVNRLRKITNPLGVKTMTYDRAGNKETETDWRGNLTTYAYDDANRLQTRTEPLQKVTTYGYDGLGNVKRETDAENGVTLHDYDGLSRRIKTTDAEQGETLIKYDGNGNKVETTDAEGRIAKHEYDGLDRLHRALADSAGENAVTVYDYDKNGNVIGVTDPNSFKTIHTYDENNRKETTRDPLNFETRFEYDKVGNKKLERNARGYARGWDYDELNRTKLVQDEAGQQTAYEYDKVGNRTEERWPNGNIVTHRYDELNRRKSTSDRVGLVGEWKYDAQGNLETETSGNGDITTHLYDELNRRYETRAPSAAGMRILAFTHDKLGNVKTERDANGNLTTHDYDKLNRLRRTFDAIGDRYLATYDHVGNKKTETDANGFVDTHTYDGLNRRTRTTDLLAGATSVVMEAGYDKAGNKLSEKDANLRETTYKYDAMNRVETVTRAGVLMVKNEYDQVGNLRFVTDALGNKVGYQYDARSFRFQEDRALGAITRFTPTAMADVAEVLDAEGRKTVNSYDFRRRLDTVTNAANEVTDYGYDLNGNRISVLKPKGAGFFQSFEYDAANRLVKVTTPAGASELTYDLHGNLIQKKDALNHATAYGDFDARNRRRLTTFADTKTEATTYDGVGNVKTLRDSNGATTTYTYDERHRERFKRYSASVDGLTEIETTYDGVGNVKTTKETYGAATRLHQRDYDAFNRLEREVDAWGDEVRHTYDLQGNRKTTTAQGATTLYGYDELNRRKSVTTAAGVTELEYDRTNLPTAVRYPNGVVSTTTYDRAMRVETVKHAKGVTVLESVAHTYDFNGNRKTQARIAGPLTENTTYDYDFDDWLTGTTVTKTDGATTSSQSIVYTLDAVGNRKREDSTATGPDAAAKTYAKVFTVDERDRVRSIATTGAGAGTTTYVYDDNGNLISKSGAAGSKTYVWNVRDRLVEVRDGPTPIARYKYNAEGLRDEVEGERRTTWVNGFAYLDKTPAGGLLAKYETHPNGRSPILAVSPAGTEFLHSDALGSSTLSTNSAGTTNATTTYDDWGSSVTTGATINKFGYTGHETDQNTGLVYFKARHYDPELGKFISADPFEGTASYPVTWNSYLYANGNPLVWIDRDGYFANDPKIEPGKNAQGQRTWTVTSNDGKPARTFVERTVTLEDLGRRLVQSRGLILLTTVLSLGGDTHDDRRMPPQSELDEVHQPDQVERRYRIHDPNTRQGRDQFAKDNPGLTDARSGSAPPSPGKPDSEESSSASVMPESGGRMIGESSRGGPRKEQAVGGTATVLAAPDAASQKRAASSQSKPGVQPYEVGTYEELKKKENTGDAIHIDHQPSHASNVARLEAELRRPPTPAEIEALRNEGTAVAVPQKWHREKSRTYGGRNTPEQIKADAENPAAAATKDSQRMIEGAARADRAAAEAAAAEVRRRAVE